MSSVGPVVYSASIPHMTPEHSRFPRADGFEMECKPERWRGVGEEKETD